MVLWIIGVELGPSVAVTNRGNIKGPMSILTIWNDGQKQPGEIDMSSLVHFRSPPLIEVVCGVSFQRIPEFTVAHYGCSGKRSVETTQSASSSHRSEKCWSDLGTVNHPNGNSRTGISNRLDVNLSAKTNGPSCRSSMTDSIIIGGEDNPRTPIRDTRPSSANSKADTSSFSSSWKPN